MHEPDKEPDTRIIQNKRSAAEWLAVISFFGGTALTIIGSLLALLGGMPGFFLIVILGIGSAVTAMIWGGNLGDERAHTTATNALVLNAAVFLLVFLLYIFFKEALQAF